MDLEMLTKERQDPQDPEQEQEEPEPKIDVKSQPKLKNIYKCCLLDPQGNPSKVIVFQGMNKFSKDDPTVFSEVEKLQYEMYDVEIVFTDKQIHPDDSVSTIKK